MESLLDKTALILVDVQKAFDDPVWGNRNNPDAEQNIIRLLEAWRGSKRPIFHIQHISVQEPSSPWKVDDLFWVNYEGSEFKDIVKPIEGETVIQKQVNSAFIGTDLEKRLRDRQCNTVIIAGLTTNQCVETTTRMAGNLGFITYLVSDATATFDRMGPDGKLYTADEIHNMTMVNLNEEFATVIHTESLLEKVKIPRESSRAGRNASFIPV